MSRIFSFYRQVVADANLTMTVEDPLDKHNCDFVVHGGKTVLLYLMKMVLYYFAAKCDIKQARAQHINFFEVND